ncbi:hypothetical protein FC756_27180 [Lysinibacillus mangiferihumi]|uniref:Uncharacterized protein n=1 Tax=Lysinibacillus mangiferihumi TaxID=1130819 RepID=A0A4U2XY42_9BACI|nr:hypothetical protein [Lysinibacillus mangiferihumi]TKI52818.1 hypothetical protein FC756_27180 [Lysinibacillus mangiferihumi]
MNKIELAASIIRRPAVNQRCERNLKSTFDLIEKIDNEDVTQHEELKLKLKKAFLKFTKKYCPKSFKRIFTWHEKDR